jgi:DNA-binding IclR family transcriptional regulator
MDTAQVDETTRPLTTEAGPGYVFRALVAIDLLSRQALTPDELAAELGVHRRTANRLIDVMSEAGWVEPTGDGGKGVRLTTRVLTIAGEVLRRTDLVSIGTPIVKRLRDRVDESSHLATIYDGSAVNVVEEASIYPLSVIQAVGNRVPLYCTAVGKAIIAYEPGLIPPPPPEGYPRYTPNTITSPEALERELDRIRQDGYAVDDSELYPDTRCIAAPVRDATGRVVASLGASGPSVRVTRDRAEAIARIVVEEASALSAALGYTTTDADA